MQKARLENWSLRGRIADYKLVPVLCGKVYGHPSFEDGTEVTTSYIVDEDIKAGWVQSANTLYTLGEPSAEYVAYLQKYHPEQIKKYNIGPKTPSDSVNPNADSGHPIVGGEKQ